ncbi:MAG: glycosyltransferase family 2 protein [Bacteroidia bacterium]|jgi:GT2 family glycosyltransferase|nr:glycosyltransferase family 2 protein [Bacteroidia bacterium]
MKLSIVIVNYNVEFFLEQCLLSVRRAMQGIDGEVFVVDNNSVDGSLRMIRSKFPEVKLIANSENTGFSKANNQAIRESVGEYVLLLNPDTVVEDDTFQKVISFMDEHPEAGGLGVKMLDGQGKFLPESKRGLPTPMTAFYKIFGLSALFPRSRRFGRYHLSYLDPDQVHEVEILAGAFMLLRRSVLDKTGLLDETFFMYGEDIDLSYRIIKAGFKNYYYPLTRIIHYKGESTKKSSVNYVFVFYNAMIIFARKHFSQQRARSFGMLIHMAIYFRASIALLSRFFGRIALPLADATIIYAGLFAIKTIWGNLTIYREGGDYPNLLVFGLLPLNVIIWGISMYFSGGYDKPYRMRKAVAGIMAGTLLFLVFYAMLPEHLRFSRAILILGMLWAMIAQALTRLTGHLLRLDGFELGENARKRFLIIGSRDEAIRVENLLKSTNLRTDFIGLVGTDQPVTEHNGFIGELHQVPDIITIYNINEIIFCSRDLPHRTIINKMTEWHKAGISFKIAPEDSLSIIGSNSINTRGDLYTVGIKAIDSFVNRRNKRLFDVLASLAFVGLFPFSLWFIQKPLRAMRNALLVLSGRRTWVGYCSEAPQTNNQLPALRKGILCPAMLFGNDSSDPAAFERINLLYARDYHVLTDLNIFLRAYRFTGN